MQPGPASLRPGEPTPDARPRSRAIAAGMLRWKDGDAAHQVDERYIDYNNAVDMQNELKNSESQDGILFMRWTCPQCRSKNSFVNYVLNSLIIGHVLHSQSF